MEDDTEICEGLVQLLESEGYEGIKALNGKQALRILGELPTRPGLILLNLMMPEMNGWEFRQAQLRDQELRAIPVVVLTASRSTIGAREELRSPAALLRKPVEADLLLDTIATHWGRTNAAN